MKLLKLICLFSLLLFVACNRDEDEDIEDQDDFESYLQDELEDQDLPALSVVIFEKNEVIFEDYLGKSNIEQNTALKSDHVFLMASVSKAITATALLQLYDDGLFELNDPVNDYLPFEVNVPGFDTDITFKMLLTHTSGIADGSALDDQYYYGQDSPVALDDFLEDYLVPGGQYYSAFENFHEFEPGTDSEYSNVGNALIGVLVQEISGKNFNAYCKENIFQPLGMDNTFWRLDEINQTIVQPYNVDNGDFKAVQHYTFTDYPNGGLRSTGRDMFKFATALAQEGTANGTELLKASTVSEMTKLQIPALSMDMGLHLFRINGEFDLWGHDGGEEGVATMMAFNKDTDIGVIILTNNGDADLDIMLEEAYEFGKSL